MDEHDDAALLRGWCDGDETMGSGLVRRRIHDADVDQKLLTRCARGDAPALARFVTRYFAGLDPAHCSQVRDDGRLQKILAASDSDLARLARWAAGNRGSADALFEHHYPMLDRFVTSKLGNIDAARDIVQDTFHDLVKQHRSIQLFRPFMFKVAANKVKAWFVRQYKSPVDTGVSGISNLHETSGHGMDAVAEGHLQRKLLLVALQSLPLDHQMVLELYTWEDFTAPQVADIMAIPLYTVKYILRQAKQTIRDFIAAHGEQVGQDAETTELIAMLDALHARAEDLAPPAD